MLAWPAAACGLGSRFLPYGPPNARQCLDDAIRQLGPDLRDLIAQTQSAVDSAVLSPNVARPNYPPRNTMFKAPAGDDELRHGFTLSQVRALSLAVVTRQTWYQSVDFDQRLEVAWHAIIEHLYTASEPPAMPDVPAPPSTPSARTSSRCTGSTDSTPTTGTPAPPQPGSSGTGAPPPPCLPATRPR